MPDPLRPDHLAFALRLHGELTASGAADLVWSPYSVACAMGLVASGAAGGTRAELTRLLGSDLDAHLAALDDAVAAGPELATGTGLWVREDLPIEADFEARLRTRPDSAVHAADFEGDPEGVRRTVNAEIAKVTRGLIDELLAPGDVHPRVQALLANALWVRLRWQEPFKVAETAEHPFHAPSGTRRTPMMHRRGQLPYARRRGWQMVTLAGDHDLALDVLLPDDAARPAALEPATLSALHRAASSTDVELTLPRFELTHRSELSSVLAGTGVRTVFTDQADLSGISTRPLRVDEVIHQARLRVDEEGAEGAAATAVVMRLAAFVPQKPVVFTADRPFHFVLRRRGAILFLGVLAEPEDPGPANG
ncbi:serpin B [Spinactinospora alkalitolerans]|uniref:Serpin B n=1 Tax=Spinactinospora alkalitolerans TaxID=687207 RepID=A0A852TS21_9ACTN|nr:serpin family protein [Spinactinospora alkalitolerans]NYE46748.1 serpin B [Spinactinospora alkalitolerans]